MVVNLVKRKRSRRTIGEFGLEGSQVNNISD